MPAKKTKCPICKGSGEIAAPALIGKEKMSKEKIAAILQKEGFSMREIMRLMNYKSPRSVALLLDKSPKKPN